MSGIGYDFPCFPRPHPQRVKEWRNKKRVTILSIDGGGIRGLVPALIMEHMEEISGKKIADVFDIIAGTSTGGILAMMAALPADHGAKTHSKHSSGASMVELYNKRGTEIFPDPVRAPTPDAGAVRKAISLVHNPVRSAVSSVTTLVGGPKYSVDGIEKVLEEYTSVKGVPLTLADTTVPVFVSAVEVSHGWGPIFFSSLDAKAETGKNGSNYRLSDVARATSAAPTYFAPKSFKNVVKSANTVQDGNVEVGCIDGGVCCNNPSLAVLNYVRSLVGADADVVIISIGTGKTEENYDTKKMTGWGQAQWIAPLINIMMQGTSRLADDQLATLAAGDNRTTYYRFQLVIPKELTSSTKRPDNVACDEMDNCSPENLQALTNLVKREFLPEMQERLMKALDAVCCFSMGC